MPRIFAFVLEHIFHLKEDEKNFGTIWASIFEPLDFIPVYTEMGSLLYEKPLRMHEKMAKELRFSPKKPLNRVFTRLLNLPWLPAWLQRTE